MRRIRSRDMKPEMIVRRITHGMGYRYRLHSRDLPGKPDLVFRPRKKLVFVTGCFWHQHDDQECKIKRIPKTNREYWVPKLARNVARDQSNKESLENVGWEILVIWECETKHHKNVRTKIREFLG